MNSQPSHQPGTAFTPTRNNALSKNLIQRKCACGGSAGLTGECPACQSKKFTGGRGLIQPKLTICQPNDKYEQEADRVADQVMRSEGSALGARMPDPKVLREANDGEDKKREILTKPLSSRITPLMQSQTDSIDGKKNEDENNFTNIQPKLLASQITTLLQREEDNVGEDEEKGLAQKKSASRQIPQVAPGAESQINSLRGEGKPLDSATRDFMEPRFGYDFSNVRMHTGTKANQFARSVDARAFTLGQDVVFGSGQNQPHSIEGKRLIAHELTHVVQQNNRLRRQPFDQPKQTRPEARPGKYFSTCGMKHILYQRHRASGSVQFGNIPTNSTTIIQRQPQPGAKSTTIVISDYIKKSSAQLNYSSDKVTYTTRPYRARSIRNIGRVARFRSAGTFTSSIYTNFDLYGNFSFNHEGRPYMEDVYIDLDYRSDTTFLLSRLSFSTRFIRVIDSDRDNPRIRIECSGRFNPFGLSDSRYVVVLEIDKVANVEIIGDHISGNGRLIPWRREGFLLDVRPTNRSLRRSVEMQPGLT